MRRVLPAVVAVAGPATGCGSGHEDAVLDVGDTYVFSRSLVLVMGSIFPGSGN